MPNVKILKANDKYQNFKRANVNCKMFKKPNVKYQILVYQGYKSNERSE